MKRLILATILMMVSLAATAEVRVAATVPNVGLLARVVGGDAVEVTVMAPPDRDPHYLEARPNMMAALRNADLLVAVGADLEIGWLPAALRGAGNRDVQTGTRGYFEAAAQVERIETDVAADRSGGDVHPMGNPHVYMDPVRMADIAEALAERLGRLDPDNAEQFRANAERFAEGVDERMAEWQSRAADAPGAVLYHKDINYLMKRLEVPILGYLEPLPGVPPTASHLRELVSDLEGREGITLLTDFQSGQGADFLERELGWSTRQMPNQVAMDAEQMSDYFDMIDRWVGAIARE